MLVDQMAVSPEYFEVLDIDVLRGRGFTQAERTAEAGVVVVSETAARRLWPNRNLSGRWCASRLRHRTRRAQAVRQARGAKVIAHVHRCRRRPQLGGGLQLPDLFAFRGVYLPTGPENAGTSLILASAGTSNGRARRCSNASRGWIPAWARSIPWGRSPECRRPSCGSPSG